MARAAKLGNYELIAQQFLRALRGARSQRAFARRLGYAANPITDWEHGRRIPSASEALRAASLAGCDVTDAFARFHPVRLRSSPTGYALADWMNAIRGSTRAQDLASRGGFSRFAVGRWLRGQSEPRVHDFFRYVDVTTARLYDLVAALVPIAKIPALRVRHETAVAIRAAAVRTPWIEAVLRAIETQGYQQLGRHQHGFLASMLDIPVQQEHQAVALLRRTRAIQKRREIFRCVDPSAVDMRGDAQRVTQLLRHWSQVAAQRAETRTDDDLFAYSVSALSRDDAQRAKEILRKAFRDVRSIVKASVPSERVMLVNLQLLMLDRGSRPPR